MNKKGDIFDLVVFIILVFAMIFIFAGFRFAFTSFYVEFDKIAKTTSNDLFNLSDISDRTMKPFIDSTKELRTISFAIIFGFIMYILLSSFLTRIHPVFFFVYVLMFIIVIIASVDISNTYQTYLTDPLLGSYLAEFKEGSSIMIYLPFIITILGFLGLIFQLWGYLTDPIDTQGGGF